MKIKVAVATVQGKAYFYIINKLKKQKISFHSIIPGQTIPISVQVVITTEKEKHLINHKKIIIYKTENEIEHLGNEVVRILKGKKMYETVIIGIDPGNIFGLAVIADGQVIHSKNCYSTKETVDEVKNVLKVVDVSHSKVIIKIGNGVPIFRDLVERLDLMLPPLINMEVVGEQGTSQNIRIGRRRELRDIVSAIRIAGRTGTIYHRGNTNGENP
ncbi:MAG: hypothetical protein GX638_13085 [Crenarchaeota archaeon]|nr:hypothetical protein [Thermoproteota archaeon]